MKSPARVPLDLPPPSQFLMEFFGGRNAQLGRRGACPLDVGWEVFKQQFFKNFLIFEIFR